MTPLWFTWMKKSKEQIYTFWGIGAGLVPTQGSNSLGDSDNSIFWGYQFITGFAGKHLGITFKYNVIQTSGKMWNISNLGGTNILLNYFF